ncbi:MAG TPA: SDR family oxidoreductase [Eubacteriales bacterium]|nr:SDR family oxidoreductase [Eubacteriales bacterium]
MPIKTALIFGGTGGIGEATTGLFTQKGYRVVFTYFNSAETANKISEKTGALSVKCDIRNQKQVSSAVELIIKKFKHIDVLVICSGVAKQNMINDVTADEFDFLIDTNLKGAFFAAKAVIPYMVSQKQGNIVFVSSLLGLDGCSCESVYSLTKGGVNAFSKSLAKELGTSGIKVNTVCPGLIDTKMNGNLTEEEKQELVESAVIKRIGMPIDVANAIFFLAETQYITGIDLTVSGGLII